MKSNVAVAQATAQEAVLPERVQEALGQLVGAAKEGLLALSVGVGLGVLSELMEEEVDEVVGPKGKHNLDRSAVRHGHEAGEVTLGGRRVAVERPRARTADGEAEVALATYEHFADRDPLSRVVLERMEMGLRWTTAGMLEAERQFRRIVDYSDLAKLAIAIEHDLTRRRQTITPAATQEAAIALTV